MTDPWNVQFERLVIEAGANTFTVDFHERLTVVAGMGRLEREGLINELVGALSSKRSGVHLEMVSDAGNRFAIFRPAGARHRVVDIDNARDVTEGFRAPDGTIDLLSRAGLDIAEAKRAMRIGPEGLTSSSETDRLIRSLGHVDQGRLWELADKVKDRERDLDEEATAVGGSSEDAEIIARIEQKHREFEVAQRKHERARAITLYGSVASVILAIPVAMLTVPIAFLPFVIFAMVAGFVSLSYYRTLERARHAEQEALGEVGAQSYLTFHLQRVNSLLSDDGGRQQLMQAAEEHRAALAQWKLIAGEATVDWALEHRQQIREAARMARTRLGVVAPSTPHSRVGLDDIAEGLNDKLRQVAKLGPGGESFPVILDDPFLDVPPDCKDDALELVARSSKGQQIIYLTADPAVAAWARVEAMTGELSVIEPSRPDEEVVAARHPRRVPRHAVA
jgi:hypothetical protein